MKQFLMLSFITFLPIISKGQSGSIAQGEVHDKVRYLHIIDGLKITSVNKLGPISNCIKNSDIERSDTLVLDVAFKKYGKDIESFSGVVEIYLKIPFIVNGILLSNLNEKEDFFESICEANMMTVKYLNRGKTNRILKKDMNSGSIVFTFSENSNCN